MKNRHRLGESADPNEKKDSARALLLSGAVHGALAAALVLNLSWKTESPEVYAELWAPEDISAGSDLNGAAKIEGKNAPEPPKPAAEPEEKEPEEAAESEAADTKELEEQARRAELEAAVEKARIEAEEARRREEARRLEDERLAKERARQEEIKRQQEEAIALEKQRQEEERRREAERLAQQKLAEERRKTEEARKAEEERKALEAQKKAEEEKRRAEEARKKAEEEKRRAEEARRKAEEKKKREEARRRELARQEAERKRIAAETRKAELARLSAQIDASKNFSGRTSGDQSVSRQNLSGSSLSEYTARVVACIRPWIAFEVAPDVRKGQYTAEFKLRLLPNGEPIGDAIQTKQSGLPAYDAAVARAIKRCNPFPSPRGGEVLPKEIYLSFDPISDNNR